MTTIALRTELGSSAEVLSAHNHPVIAAAATVISLPSIVELLFVDLCLVLQYRREGRIRD